ncbi:MAG TPA: hypothetical protein PLB68_07190, partial [Candidatus Aminicenantes bacterium]|nr:hypothetical protein [Candidatus Aminicenantes bacterium]
FTLLFWVLLLLVSLYPSFRIPLGELPRYLLPLLLFHVSYAFVHALFLFPRNAEALASLKGLNTDVGRMVLFQSHQIRLKSLFSLSTQFAGILTVLLPFLLLWALRRKRRWIGVSALVLFALTIALAKSFGSLLEIGAVALDLLRLPLRRGERRRRSSPSPPPPFSSPEGSSSPSSGAANS